MQPFRLHVFACDQKKPEGVPCCSARGSAKTIDALRKEIAAGGLIDEVQVTVCGSLGLCERGLNVVVYPKGVWYSGVTPDDVGEIVQSHFRDGRPVERLMNRDAAAVAGEIRTNRDRMLAAMRARDASGALPDDLVQTLRGYQESRVLLTALELDVFTAIGEEATAADVSTRAGADARAMEMLLDALVAMGLLTKVGGRFRTTPMTSRFFATGSKDDSRVAMLHNASLWRRWSTLTDAVRTGTAVTYQEMDERGEEWTRAFIAAMHRNAAERAPLVVQAVGTEGVGRMLDVGGGSAAYSIAFAQASDSLQAVVFDVATVLPIARGHIRDAGLEARVTTREGDLRSDRFGGGYNLVFASAICHMLGVEENEDLLKRCYDALEPGGRLVVQDFILEPEKTAPKNAALFSLNMLVGTKRGSSYSEAEYREWMETAGFQGVTRVRLPGPTGLMIGTRI
jgi:(2Fe-2S) ferredoxin/precorrin-6B methylase 2